MQLNHYLLLKKLKNTEVPSTAELRFLTHFPSWLQNNLFPELLVFSSLFFNLSQFKFNLI